MTEIHEIPLTGLIGSNPLGAMAAFGLLRVCSEIKELEKSRLFWRMKDDWIAVLAFKGENSISEDKLASLLLSHLMHFPSENVFGWNKNINEEKDKFRGRLQKHVENSSISRRLLVDFFSAFASDMVTDSQEKWVKPTAFYMVKSGFLDSMNKKIQGT
jgi:hypothetical protein